MIGGLTARERDCLRAIERLTVDGVSPSFEELRVELALPSRSNVHRLVHGLRDRGAIAFLPNRARSIFLLGTAIGPEELGKLSSAQLRVTAAHVAGILAHREGGEHAHKVFNRIANRVSGRPEMDGPDA